MRDDVAFVIPVYNEGQVVRGVLEHVLEHYSTVVCVNDCSRDNSASEIERTGAYLVNHPINMGQGAALQTGFEFVKQLPGVEYVVTFDSDGQHRLEDVSSMLATMDETGVDIVLGSRFLGTEAVNMPRIKRAVLKAAIAFSNITSGVKLTDTHNGLRVLRRKVAEEINLTMPGMAHASEFIELIKSHDYSYTEVPVEIVYSDYSRGKGQPIINAVNIAFDMLLRKAGR